MARLGKLEPERHLDGRWIYSDTQLLKIVKLLPLARRVKILEKAINTIENDNRPKIYGIADALGCYYDDSGFWATKTKIRVPKQIKK